MAKRKGKQVPTDDKGRTCYRVSLGIPGEHGGATLFRPECRIAEEYAGQSFVNCKAYHDYLTAKHTVGGQTPSVVVNYDRPEGWQPRIDGTILTAKNAGKLLAEASPANDK